MPVMPEPTTSTSTSGMGAPATVICTDRLVYGRGGRGTVAFDARGALRDGPPGPRAQGALLRRRLLRPGGRPALAPRLADGVPARGAAPGRRLRRVPDPRPVGDRAAHRGGRAGVPERVPPPR